MPIKVRGYNYVDRSNGAVAIEIDGNSIFFYHKDIIAVRIGSTLYRTDVLKGGIVYQRVRNAINNSPEAKNVHMASKHELLQHAETVMALAVSRAFDERLLGDGK